MTLPNDSVAVTPGTGATIATHLVNSKEYQVVMQANAAGHIMGSLDTFTAHVASMASSANKPFFHIFNASGSGKIVKVRKLYIIPSLAVNALTGQTWSVRKTSAVGTTGNTAVTPRPHDSASAALPGQITVAHSFTAGGTDAFTYFDIVVAPEETLPAIGIVPYMNLLPVDGDFVTDYVLREGEGLKLLNVTGGAYSYGATGVFTVE